MEKVIRRGRRTRRSILVAAFSILVISAFVVVPVQPAAAAGTILVSNDGVTFGTVYPGVLFDGIANTVPGDIQTEVFYMRNTGPDDGYVRLTLRNVTGDAVLLNALTVSASVPSQPGSDIVMSKANPCWVLNEGILLPAGTTMAVTTELIFAASSGNPTQNTTADFDIGVNLNDTAVALPPTECGGSGSDVPGTVPHPDDLSFTGSDVPIMLISVTAFITGAGLFLVLAARRRKRGNDDETRST